jgi:membrane protein implicated in regulation of membrane protease activity
MADWIGWLILAGVIVILELFTGTFYLLMISLGLAAGGLAAFLGLGREWQYITGAIVGIVATIVLHRSRYGRKGNVDAANDPNVNLDIGESLQIQEWKTKGEQGTTRTMYRGAMWDVQLAPGATAEPGTFVIKEIRGSRLIVANLS